MTAVINGCTCMGTPEEILRLMQLAGKLEYITFYSDFSTEGNYRIIPFKFLDSYNNDDL